MQGQKKKLLWPQIFNMVPWVYWIIALVITCKFLLFIITRTTREEDLLLAAIALPALLTFFLVFYNILKSHLYPTHHPAILTQWEAARCLHITEDKLKRLAIDKKIACHTSEVEPLFLKDELIEYVRKHTYNPDEHKKSLKPSPH